MSQGLPITVISTGLSLTAAGAAAACPDVGHPRLSAGPAIDFGHGIVGQTQTRRGRIVGSETYFAEGIYLFHDCATGESIWLDTHREEPRGSVAFDHRDTAAAMVAETAVTALGDLERSASAAGIPVREIGATGIETCLCASHYPDLRGGKVPYEAVR